MSKLKTILTPLKYILPIIGLMLIIGFSNMKRADKYVNTVSVNIDNQYRNYFIDENDVYNLIDETGKGYLLNNVFASLDLKSIEGKVKSHRFVEDAEVYQDLFGNLTVEVKQNRPIARVLNDGYEDEYISTSGLLLPLSSHFTARVLLITKDESVYFSEGNMTDNEQGKQLFDLLNFIKGDDFWKAQIAGIHVNENYQLTLEPQVTKQKIEFGKAVDIEEKFEKLKIFYKEILPHKGWNTYETVNLKYRNQIVCK